MAIRDDVTFADEAFQGEDLVLDFTVYKPDNTTLEDTTGFTFEWLLVPNDASEVDFIKKTSASGAIANNPPIASVTLTAADTAAVAAGTHYHTLWRVDTGSHTVESYGSFMLRDAPQP